MRLDASNVSYNKYYHLSKQKTKEGMSRPRIQGTNKEVFFSLYSLNTIKNQF